MADTRLEPVVVSDDERRTLENWVKRRSTAQSLAQRARVVLASAEGESNVAVAARLRVHRDTVARWGRRFLELRLDGLPDEPRPGVPRSITDAQVEDVVARTLEEAPEGSTHWSKRDLARKVGISATSVQQIWRAFGLQPWRTETFKVSPDPLLPGGSPGLSAALTSARGGRIVTIAIAVRPATGQEVSVRRWHILASLLFIAGAIGLGVSPARAATLTGLCMSNYASTCARINGQMVDAWPRDISGDTNQQFTDGYIGQVASTNGRCWPFTCGDGLNATYNNDSVWDFRQINTNNCINVFGTQNQANLAACSIDNSAEWFVWTPTGALINVYQSNYWGSPQYLVGKGVGQCQADYYQPLITLNTDVCVSTWVLANAT